MAEEPPPPPLTWAWLQLVRGLLGAAFALGLPSNLVVLATVLGSPGLRRRLTNLLIVNLCLCDLVTVLVDIPLMWRIASRAHYQDGLDGGEDSQCELQVFCHALAIAGQAAALVAVARERYQSVARPQQRLQQQQAPPTSGAGAGGCCCWPLPLATGPWLAWSLGCWATAAAVASAQLLLAKGTVTHAVCSGVAGDNSSSSAEYLVIAFGALAFLVIVGHYLAILVLVKRHLAHFDGGSAVATTPTSVVGDQSADQSPPVFGAVCVRSDQNRQSGRRQFEAQIALRLFYIMASFVAVWLPYALALPVLASGGGGSGGPQDRNLLYGLHTLTTSAAALNPLVYALPNGQFRAALAAALRRLLANIRSL
ncbi:hypothetical protein HDE_01343 [Halotydeus destructor]|nr:hypothetical protein HDE_01343 [Halotydeus destructor]